MTIMRTIAWIGFLIVGFVCGVLIERCMQDRHGAPTLTHSGTTASNAIIEDEATLVE